MANVWEQRKLGEVCLRVQGNDGRMDLPTLTISAANGWMKQEDRFSGNIAGKEQKNYTLLHKGELSYNHGNSKLAKYGTVFSLQTYEEALVPRVYHSFKIEDGNADFLEYYFATKLPDRELGKLISSGARMDGLLNIGYDEFMGIQMVFPSIAEQNRVASYFRCLDTFITLHQRKAICTKNVRNNHILSIFLWERAVFMGKMILYHGSPNEMIHPIYGLGEDKHDYGRGFYLTANIELAKEWAVCRPDQSNGWVHKYELVTDDLRILDFQQLNVLSWLAELMKHREASDSKRYRMLAAKFIEKYGIDTDGYDVIKGWRADASYFYIAKAFVRDEIDVDILEELLFLGDLGIQYCIKSEKGYANLHELESELLPVSFADFNDKYNERDIAARENMRKLIDSDDNKVTKVFSTLI